MQGWYRLILTGFISCYLNFSWALTDTQLWENITAIGNVYEQQSRTNYKYWLEQQERFGESVQHITQSLLRTGMGYDVTSNSSLWLGYALIKTGLPLTTVPITENRIWQQWLWIKNYRLVSLQSRTRLEERFFNHDRSISYRLRQFAKVTVPFSTDSSWSLVLTDELFYYSTTVADEVVHGLDQNRVFIGLGYNLKKQMRVEMGYLNQAIFRRASADFIGNIIAINLLLNF